MIVDDRRTTDGRGRAGPALWFVSYGLTLLGSGIAAAVLPLLVLARTGDVLAAGLLATVTTAASAATGLVSGLLVDRVDRRVVAVVSDVLGAVAIAALPLVDLLWGLNLGWFLVLGVLGAMARVPGMTAQETLLPVLARLGDPRPGRLDRLIAARENVGNVLVLAGPGVGGLLVAMLGPASAVLWVTAATSLAAAVTTLAIDPRAGAVGPREPGPSGGVVRRAVHDLAVSWRFLGRSRIVLGATVVSAVLVAVVVSVQTTLMPAYFTGVGLPALTGLTLSALAAGGLVGSTLYAALVGRVSRRTWFVIGMAGFGGGFALLGSLAAPWVVLAAAALVGLTNAPVSAVLGVLIIEATPDALRGRVLGAQNTLLLAAPALTTAPVAALASAAGLGAAGALLAAVAVLTALVALFVPAFRRLDGITDRAADGTADENADAKTDGAADGAAVGTVIAVDPAVPVPSTGIRRQHLGSAPPHPSDPPEDDERARADGPSLDPHRT